MTTPHTTTARKPSRFVRPERLPPLWLQRRDREILLSVFQHRYLSTLHVQALHFSGVSLRQAQTRLRRLWAHKFLDRHFVPFVWTGGEAVPATARRPFYCLARRGAEVVAENLGLDLAEIPHTTSQNSEGFSTFLHHLVVTDLLVALAAACRGREDVQLAGVLRETALRKTLRRRLAEGWRGSVLVPDGAFTLVRPGSGRIVTFYIEVVRAGAKAGNQSLRRRFERYAEACHRGTFRDLYGHHHVRAVLTFTTSASRAEHLRQLAADLTHGRRLFWFGVFGDPGGMTSASLATILDSPWSTATGENVSILQSLGPPPAPALPPT